MKPSGPITYSLVLPIEVARICAEPCAFCPYPLGGRDVLMPFGAVAKEVERARRLGATMIDFASGDAVERLPEVRRELERERLHSFCDYLARCAEIAARARHGAAGDNPGRSKTQEGEGGEPALPLRLDVGPLSQAQWEKMRRHFAGARLLLTSVDRRVIESGALRGCATQNPEARLNSMIEAAEFPMPLAAGTMIGIGESAASRDKAIRVLAQVAKRYGHIQSLLLQAFRPHPATRMASHPPTPLSDMLEAVALARRVVPPLVRVQINALDWREHLPDLIEAGANDLGDLNLRVLAPNGSEPQAQLATLLAPLKAIGCDLRPRSVLGFDASRLPGMGKGPEPLIHTDSH